jgi:hypothetical protein
VALRTLLPAASIAQPASHAPALWLLLALTALVLFKILYVDSATTWLRCVSSAHAVCGAQTATQVPFTGGFTLRGYDVPSYRVQRGELVRANLFWEGSPSVGLRLHSFVHIRNSQKEQAVNPRTGSDIWAQEDHETPGGLLTTDFLPGKLYLDEFRVRVPDDMPPGIYFLEIGWSNPATGEQLDPQADSVKAPLKVLWRSVLLPSITVQ